MMANARVLARFGCPAKRARSFPARASRLERVPDLARCNVHAASAARRGSDVEDRRKRRDDTMRLHPPRRVLAAVGLLISVAMGFPVGAARAQVNPLWDHY
jgi:hypothetical protein